MGRRVERLFQVVGTKAQVPRLRGKTVRGVSSETIAQSRKAGGERGGEGQTTMSKRDSVISLRMDLPFLLKKERLGLLSHCSF